MDGAGDHRLALGADVGDGWRELVVRGDDVFEKFGGEDLIGSGQRRVANSVGDGAFWRASLRVRFAEVVRWSRFYYMWRNCGNLTQRRGGAENLTQRRKDAKDSWIILKHPLRLRVSAITPFTFLLLETFAKPMRRLGLRFLLTTKNTNVHEGKGFAALARSYATVSLLGRD